MLATTAVYLPQGSRCNKSARMSSRRNNQSNNAELFVVVPTGTRRRWDRIIVATGVASCLTLMGKLRRPAITRILPDNCNCARIKRRAFTCMAR